jgi:hypothetical protein
MIIESGGKKFEKPDAGAFVGTVIDVIDVGLVPSKNPKFPEAKNRIRLLWVLDKNDSEGKPYVIIEQPPMRMNDGGGGTKKSRLYEIWEGILQHAPAVPYETEDLIGKSNLLYLVKDGDFVKIAGFMPVPYGKAVPTAPVGFLRDKDDPKKRAARLAKAQGQAGGSFVQTVTVAPAQTVAAPAQEITDEDIPF